MLYLVGTPIGNLGEMSYRAVETLKNCDYILCEDTRTSMILLSHYEIKKPTFSYHKFNEKDKVGSIVSDLKNGKEVALISDAGMPGISDPGNILINECILNGIDYSVVSGPSACINAFISSGFQPPFTFIGFIPNKNKDIEKLLAPFQNINSSLIFYVAMHDIDSFFNTINKYFPNRDIFVVRELTKKFEEKTFLKAGEKFNGTIKGEFVVVLNQPNIVLENNYENIDSKILELIENGTSNSEISKIVSKEFNVNKNDIYKRVLNISGK